MFLDRKDAALQLADYLMSFEGQDGIVLGIPRGGIVTAHYLAEVLQWPLGYVLAKKIGYPTNKEYAIGAVGLQDVLITEGIDISDEQLENSLKEIRHTLRNRLAEYAQIIPPPILKDKLVIITDDGAATGRTVQLAIKEVKRQEPSIMVVALPVAPPETIRSLEEMVDEVVCLYTPQYFRAVGHFYRDFPQVRDEQVLEYLRFHVKEGQSSS